MNTSRAMLKPSAPPILSVDELPHQGVPIGMLQSLRLPPPPPPPLLPPPPYSPYQVQSPTFDRTIDFNQTIVSSSSGPRIVYNTQPMRNNTASSPPSSYNCIRRLSIFVILALIAGLIVIIVIIETKPRRYQRLM